MNPRIGIPIPTTIDIAYNQRSWPSYAGGVSQSGGEPIALDLALPAEQFQALAATCDGFLLPGSPADVEPALYDTPRIPECGPVDAAREQADYMLLEHAAVTGKPLLGICYGCQSMNVFYGGSLIQDLSPLPVNHAAGGKVAIAHSVSIPRDSLLGSILLTDPAAAEEATPTATQPHDNCLRLPVNTSHHQSVAACGERLRIVARCPDDDVIEAIELNHAEMFHVEHPQRRFLLGVQWHPERSFEISAASRALFNRLIAEATQFAGFH